MHVSIPPEITRDVVFHQDPTDRSTHVINAKVLTVRVGEAVFRIRQAKGLEGIIIAADDAVGLEPNAANAVVIRNLGA